MDVIEQSGVDGRISRLADLLRVTGTALREATAAFLGGQPVASTTLAAVEAALREVRRGVEDHASSVLAVSDGRAGGDVRRIVAEVQINANIEAMAGMARQVADIARSRAPRPPASETLAVIVREMSRVGLGALDQTADVLRTGSAQLTQGVDDAYREVGQLQRRLVEACADAELAVALDASLVGRLHERFAEHTVSVAYHARVLAEGVHRR